MYKHESVNYLSKHRVINAVVRSGIHAPEFSYLLVHESLDLVLLLFGECRSIQFYE